MCVGSGNETLPIQCFKCCHTTEKANRKSTIRTAVCTLDLQTDWLMFYLPLQWLKDQGVVERLIDFIRPTVDPEVRVHVYDHWYFYSCCPSFLYVWESWIEL